MPSNGFHLYLQIFLSRIWNQCNHWYSNNEIKDIFSFTKFSEIVKYYLFGRKLLLWNSTIKWHQICARPSSKKPYDCLKTILVRAHINTEINRKRGPHQFRNELIDMTIMIESWQNLSCIKKNYNQESWSLERKYWRGAKKKDIKLKKSWQCSIKENLYDVHCIKKL